MLERKEKGYKDLHLCLDENQQHTEGQCLQDTNACKRAASPVLYYKVESFICPGTNLDFHHTQTPLCGHEEALAGYLNITLHKSFYVVLKHTKGTLSLRKKTQSSAQGACALIHSSW